VLAEPGNRRIERAVVEVSRKAAKLAKQEERQKDGLTEKWRGYISVNECFCRSSFLNFASFAPWREIFPFR
jgi:hypothetical protein